MLRFVVGDTIVAEAVIDTDPRLKPLNTYKLFNIHDEYESLMKVALICNNTQYDTSLFKWSIFDISNNSILVGTEEEIMRIVGLSSVTPMN